MDAELVIQIDVDGRAVKYHRHPDFSDYYMRFHKPVLMKIPTMLYIIHVGYSKGDMQLGVTGACKLNESYADAAKREVWEEMGIGFRKWNYLESISKTKGFPHIYLVNAEDYFVPTDMKLDDRVDDKKRRLSVIIVGTPQRLVEIMGLAKPHDPKEKITYYSAVSVKKLQKEYEKIDD
jgi:8-oxo-dGTP pyrophosphatase MutT (NUDIX family)